MNEILLLLSLPLVYGTVLAAWRCLGKTGLYALNIFFTVLANLEVLLLVEAFGLEQTLGNVMFAASFVTTDILSENVSRRAADRAVTLGIAAQLLMIVFTQFWLLFTPSDSDWAMPAFRTIFSATPRLLAASLAGYALSQKLDVWLYHRFWRWTQACSGSDTAFLWLRNNAATLLSQLVNTILFNLLAFAGRYDLATLASIILSSYLIFIVTSLADTPVVYLARKWYREGKIKEQT